jgi:phosphoribosylaminoimidazole-succinocarboxamide synthase
MAEEFLDRVYPAILTKDKKKFRYKTLAEDLTTINQFFFEYLNTFNIPTSFIAKTDEKTLRFTSHESMSFYIRVVNYIDPRFAGILGKSVWDSYAIPVLEYFTVASAEEMISQNHIIATGLTEVESLKTMNRLCTKINAVLKSYFERREIALISFDCFFGKTADKLLLCGEFDPFHLRILGKSDLSSDSEKIIYPANSADLKVLSENLLTIIRT